ncbi:electron transporter RnfB [Desulfobacter hydrogenophilus]|uniref:Ion-translocating oxidoreductase complex subunit B n=1 Tax=Desulfobacter hydrogenophilus TaxID=2291 RepID=A0A328F7Y1_9BACT|nr:RnfABCDGE type electron transport complex subunit B [Desulfobacter hydrogenophilus]NDY74037.1 RnfABCDGE type electron transport complex subunit B [Desulfobacter hydrogenophilus]QBH15314.1 RnfABCDGE type electron transport complex subunit B [Desulfobacter hydrogenophilus]RAM00784.1 electron transporter RnfB [Desulfobacter hydrogenophilus]
MMISLGIAGASMLVMAVIFSYILGWANKKFMVEVDPKIEAVREALPGANCGGCGYLGCSDYAVAIVMDNDPVNKCTVGGKACAKEIAGIMGVDVGDMVPMHAIVHCNAPLSSRLGLTQYMGEQRCASAQQVAGVQACTFGCLGFGDCVQACNYDAIHIVDGLAQVDYEKCIGCGACAKACPRGIISIEGFREETIPVVACSNKDKAKDAKAVCKNACVGCKACAKVSDLFTISENLSKCSYDDYSVQKREEAMKAIEKCPTGCIHFVGTQVE